MNTHSTLADLETDALISEGGDYAARRFGTVPGDLVYRLTNALRHETLANQTNAQEADCYRKAIKAALKVNLFKVGMVSYGIDYQDDVHRILSAGLRGDA